MLGRAADLPRSHQFHRAAVGEDPDVIADVAERLLEDVGELTGAARLPTGQQVQYLPPQGMPQREEQIVGVAVGRCHVGPGI